MARIPRVHIEGALFYVTSRGDNNADIFKEDDDYRTYLELLRKYKAQYNFRLFAYALLPNHLNLLIELREGIKVSDIMHDLSSSYTKYFNGKYQRKGHLFQERYKMAIVEKKEYISSEEIKEIGPSFTAGIQAQEMEDLDKKMGKNAILGSDAFVEMVNRQAAAIEASQARKTGPEHRKLIYISLAGLTVLAVFTFYLYGKTALMRKKYRDEIARKNQELQNRMTEERKKVVKDLEEKYSADRVSYEAMAKRLELEKEKAKEMESKLKK